MRCCEKRPTTLFQKCGPSVSKGMKVARIFCEASHACRARRRHPDQARLALRARAVVDLGSVRQ